MEKFSLLTSKKRNFGNVIRTFKAQVHEQCPNPSCVNHQECLGSGELGEGGKGSRYLKPFGYWWQGPLVATGPGCPSFNCL
jgi:hypothetical protein